MAFASTIIEQAYEQGRRRTRGTFSTGAVYVGNIDTGLLTCEDLLVYYVTAGGPTPLCVTTILPAAGNSVAIDGSTDKVGRWIAYGPA